MTKVTEIAIKQTNDSLVESLENMLVDAKSGELTGLMWVAQTQGGFVQSGWTGILTNRSRTMVGEMEFVKRDIMEACD